MTNDASIYQHYLQIRPTGAYRNKVHMNKATLLASEYPKKIQLLYLPTGLIVQRETASHLSLMIYPLMPNIRKSDLQPNATVKYVGINPNWKERNTKETYKSCVCVEDI